MFQFTGIKNVPQSVIPLAKPAGEKLDANTDEYLVESDLATLIGIDGMRSTRSGIQKKFIQFAIQRGLVNATTHNYEIFKEPDLYKRMQVKTVVAKDIFKQLKRVFLQKIE